MEAHSGLSEKLLKKTGFKGIWASGLAIYSSLGVRDNNVANWMQARFWGLFNHLTSNSNTSNFDAYNQLN